MKKVVSMFMALAMVFTMGPVMVVRAENVCEGGNCQANDESLAGFAWCKENQKDCVTYLGETAWDGTKLVGGKVWNGTKLVGEKFWDETAWARGRIADGAVTMWKAAKNYNYTQVGENMKWCAHNVGDCATSVYDGTAKWFGDRVDELAKFKGDIEAFCDYDLNDQAKWPFWAMVGLAAYTGADAALSMAKLTVKAAWAAIKLGGKVIKIPFTLVMKMFNPCFRAFKLH